MEEETGNYIRHLEHLVFFLAACYQKNEYVFRSKHLETCASDNPERRELTEQEWSEFNRFATVQGFRNRKSIKTLSEYWEKDDPIKRGESFDLEEIIPEIQKKYGKLLCSHCKKEITEYWIHNRQKRILCESCHKAHAVHESCQKR